MVGRYEGSSIKQSNPASRHCLSPLPTLRIWTFNSFAVLASRGGWGNPWSTVETCSKSALSTGSQPRSTKLSIPMARYLAINPFRSNITPRGGKLAMLQHMLIDHTLEARNELYPSTVDIASAEGCRGRERKQGGHSGKNQGESTLQRVDPPIAREPAAQPSRSPPVTCQGYQSRQSVPPRSSHCTADGSRTMAPNATA